MKRFLLLSMLLVSVLSTFAVQPALIPKPAEVEWADRAFYYDESVAVLTSSRDMAAYAGRYFSRVRLYVDDPQRESFFASDRLISLMIDPSVDLPEEGYLLSVGSGGISVRAGDYGGLFNGFQTLLQLFPNDIYSHKIQSATIPAVEIEDYPRFSYRGMMLDVARTFSPKEDVMRLIDNLSHHKINKFHWHLADDEGWRVEIVSHPELTQIAAFRGVGSPIMAVYGKWDERYGGFYTQRDVREVVEYARVRNVEVIPEIDLPGHSRAISKVFPEIICDFAPDLTASSGYDRRNVWCVSKESNYELLEDILGELCALFPSEHFHVGGDEVAMSQWQSCPDCSRLMLNKGYKNGSQLEGYFMQRMIGILAANGKRAGVWNEAVEGGSLPDDVLVYGWQNPQKAREVATSGYSTVVMPGKYFYFDMKQTPFEPGHQWAAIIDTRDNYMYDFTQQGFSDEAMQNVVGVEAAFWSEIYLSQKDKYPNYLDYQLFPRICSLCEVGWSEQRDWNDFEGRLAVHYDRLKAMGISYRTEPVVQPKANYLRPEFTLSSPFGFRSGQPASVLHSYRFDAFARTTRSCNMGDKLIYTFRQPLRCSSIEFNSGFPYLPTCLIPSGYVEVSYDGKTYMRMAELTDGMAVVNPTQPVKMLRVVSTAKGNSESSIVIQPLKIL